MQFRWKRFIWDLVKKLYCSHHSRWFQSKSSEVKDKMSKMQALNKLVHESE